MISFTSLTMFKNLPATLSLSFSSWIRDLPRTTYLTWELSMVSKSKSQTLNKEISKERLKHWERSCRNSWELILCQAHRTLMSGTFRMKLVLHWVTVTSLMSDAFLSFNPLTTRLMTHPQLLTALCGLLKISRRKTLFIEMFLKDTLRKSSDQLECAFGLIPQSSTLLINLPLFETSKCSTMLLRHMINSKVNIKLFFQLKVSLSVCILMHKIQLRISSQMNASSWLLSLKKLKFSGLLLKWETKSKNL